MSAPHTKTTEQGPDLSGTPLAALSPEAWRALAPSVERRRLADRELLVEEGDFADEVFFLIQGSASVTRDVAGRPQVVNRLSAPTTVGVAAIFGDERRTATVRADGPIELLALPADALRRLGVELPEIADLTLSLATDAIALLRGATAEQARALEELEDQKETQRMLGVLFVTVVMGFSAYCCLLVAEPQLEAMLGHEELVKVPVLLGSGALVAGYARYTGLPADFWGLSLRGWARHLWQSAVWTAPMLLIAALVKILLIWDQPGAFVIGALDPSWDAPGWGLLAVYAALVPLQEFITRGVVQSALQSFLTGRWGTWMAILATNGVFLVAHVYISLTLAFISFVCGVIWGWMYVRQGTLVGVTFSHFLLGIWAFFVLGMPGIG